MACIRDWAAIASLKGALLDAVVRYYFYRFFVSVDVYRVLFLDDGGTSLNLDLGHSDKYSIQLSGLVVGDALSTIPTIT